MPTLTMHSVPGDPGTSGLAHGRLVEELLNDPFRTNYTARIADALGHSPELIESRAVNWLAQLPQHFAEEIHAIARGARVPSAQAAAFLYADISSREHGVETAQPNALRTPNAKTGPLCSSAITELQDRRWIARNCDWLTATLTRGNSAVHHHIPGRVPVLALGIRGDIDVDTGINRAGLWLHLHTMYDASPPDPAVETISWLFWAREALETCESIDQLLTFSARTRPDRGVIAVTTEATTGRAGVLELSPGKNAWHEHEADHTVATNHPCSYRIDDQRARRARPGSSVGRWCALDALLRDHPPEHAPDDLIDLLAHERVEMRQPKHLRTIYSAVACPTAGTIWFAAGAPDGTPAASRDGAWTPVELPW